MKKILCVKKSDLNNLSTHHEAHELKNVLGGRRELPSRPRKPEVVRIKGPICTRLRSERPLAGKGGRSTHTLETSPPSGTQE